LAVHLPASGQILPFTGLIGNQTQASFSGQFVVMPNTAGAEMLQSPVI